jgi:hypothetical protein
MGLFGDDLLVPSKQGKSYRLFAFVVPVNGGGYRIVNYFSNVGSFSHFDKLSLFYVAEH